jgi:hypothetical protein
MQGPKRQQGNQIQQAVKDAVFQLKLHSSSWLRLVMASVAERRVL